MVGWLVSCGLHGGPVCAVCWFAVVCMAGRASAGLAEKIKKEILINICSSGLNSEKKLPHKQANIIIGFSDGKLCVALKRAVLNVPTKRTIYLALALEVFLGKRTAWMLGRTPPCAMVTPDRSLFNSSSFRIANCK